MKLRIGTIAAGVETPVGDGINRPVRATVRVDEASHAAVIKRLPPQAVLAECFCALLLRGWGLPVPEPVLIIENQGLVFASLDSGFPSLKQRLGWHETLPQPQQDILSRLGAAIVCGWSDAPRALAADEAIANADRNLGNFLWDGAEHAYIDHERTLGLAAHTANLMAMLAELAGKSGEMEAAAVTAALALDASLPGSIKAPDTAPEQVDFSPLVEYVEARLPALASRVLARFPKPHDLLAGLDPP